MVLHWPHDFRENGSDSSLTANRQWPLQLLFQDEAIYWYWQATLWPEHLFGSCVPFLCDHESSELSRHGCSSGWSEINSWAVSREVMRNINGFLHAVCFHSFIIGRLLQNIAKWLWRGKTMGCKRIIRQCVSSSNWREAIPSRQDVLPGSRQHVHHRVYVDLLQVSAKDPVMRTRRRYPTCRHILCMLAFLISNAYGPFWNNFKEHTSCDILAIC